VRGDQWDLGAAAGAPLGRLLRGRRLDRNPLVQGAASPDESSDVSARWRAPAGVPPDSAPEKVYVRPGPVIHPLALEE
jgi:hypothetical protein